MPPHDPPSFSDLQLRLEARLISPWAFHLSKDAELYRLTHEPGFPKEESRESLAKLLQLSGNLYLHRVEELLEQYITLVSEGKKRILAEQLLRDQANVTTAFVEMKLQQHALSKYRDMPLSKLEALWRKPNKLTQDEKIALRAELRKRQGIN